MIYLEPWPLGKRIGQWQVVVVQLRDGALPITEDPQDYWIGVCCVTENLLPDKFLDERPRDKSGEYRAIQLMFRGDFRWIKRNYIFQPNEGLEGIQFETPEVTAEWASGLSQAEANNDDPDMWQDYWQGVFEDQATAQEERPSKRPRASADLGVDDTLLITPSRAPSPTTPTTRFVAPEAPDFLFSTSPHPPSGQGQSNNTSTTGPQSRDRSDSVTTAKNSSPTRPPSPSQSSPSDNVRVFIGPSNQLFTLPRRLLKTSPVLTSLITTQSPQTPFIMHPTLATISPAIFQACIDFLDQGDCGPHLAVDETNTPVLIAAPAQTDVDYAAELVRAGALYSIAHRFALPALATLVVRKVSLAIAPRLAAQPEKGAGKAILVFARAVLEMDPEAGYLQPETQREGGRVTEETVWDVAEEYAVDYLGQNLREFCTGPTEQGREFWRILELRGDGIARAVARAWSAYLNGEDGDEEDGDPEDDGDGKWKGT